MMLDPLRPPAQLQNLVILRLPEVKQRCGLSRSSIYARIARGEFPRFIRLGANSVGWNAAEIDRWIADRIAERDNGGAA